MRSQAFFEFLISLALLFWITLTHATNTLISHKWDDLNSTADDYAVIISGFPVDNKEMTYLRVMEYVEGILNKSEFDRRFKKEANKSYPGLNDNAHNVRAAEGNPKGIADCIMLTDCKDLLNQYRRKTDLEALEKVINLFQKSRYPNDPRGETQKEWDDRQVRAKQVREPTEDCCCLSCGLRRY